MRARRRHSTGPQSFASYERALKVAALVSIVTAVLSCGGAIETHSLATDAGVADSVGTSDPVDALTAVDSSPPDATPDPGPLLGAFQLTYYWVTTEAEFSGSADTSLYDKDCGVLAVVPAGFAASIRIEGTGRLKDGRVLNYWGSCSCPSSPCFFELPAEMPWGIGVSNIPLVPFRSVAVDTDVITIGTGLYIPEFDQVALPAESTSGSGLVHDGCVVAVDVGGGIGGQHIDFFAGLRTYYVALDGALGLSSVTVRDGGERCADLAP